MLTRHILTQKDHQFWVNRSDRICDRRPRCSWDQTIGHIYIYISSTCMIHIHYVCIYIHIIIYIYVIYYLIYIYIVYISLFYSSYVYLHFIVIITYNNNIYAMTVKPGTAGRGGRLCGRQGCSAFGGRLGRGTVVVDLKIVIISTVGYIGYIYI